MTRVAIVAHHERTTPCKAAMTAGRDRGSRARPRGLDAAADDAAASSSHDLAGDDAERRPR